MSLDWLQAQSLVEQQKEQTQQDKSNDPNRFAPKRNTAKISRLIPRQVGAAEQTEATNFQFVKEVSVKKIEENVAQLRATKAAPVSGAGRPGQGSSNHSGTQDDQFPVHHGGSGSYSGAKPILQLLSACVAAKLDGTEVLRLLDPRAEMAVAFVEMCPQFPDLVAADVWQALLDKTAAACADSCLASPKEFWTFFSTMLTALTHLHHVSHAFQSMFV